MAFSCKSSLYYYSTFDLTKIFGLSINYLCLLAIVFILPFLLTPELVNASEQISPITRGEETEINRQQQQKPNNNDDDEDEGEKAIGTGKKCEIKVHIVKHVRGECVRLFGGKPACQSEEYVDPESEQCRNDEQTIFV
ncbi:hypothetical protein Mgra_00009364 [Meloidogyne graminicola]|uniref:Uncharacterized protein n=1 Tax=Meloidogyne graminicola TaxID=189291 RepID=A0A8S9ZD69_9BILA|nr:hypothetical protein Mgra_00009364 [Meloidogyne graminicola]